MRTDKIEALVVELSKDPFNPRLNLNVAKEYERLNQTASASSFYLRAAEYGGDDKEVVYASLLKISQCLADQTGREHTVINSLMQALTVCPNRPEAYFLISQLYERQAKWQECFTFAELGLATPDHDPLPVNVGYYDRYCLEFEKAVSGWWIGRNEESRQLFHDILKIKGVKKEYKESIRSNLASIWKEQHAVQ